MTNNLNISVTAGLDKIKSVTKINQDIMKIEGQIKKLKLQATLDKGKSITEILKQIKVLNEQKRNLYVDLKLRKKDLKSQYKQAIASIQTQPLNVNVNTAVAQNQMSGLTNSVRATTSETVTLASSLKKALTNSGLVISSQTALQLVRKAAQEATAAVKEYDDMSKNLQIITGQSKESVREMMSDLADKSLDYKVDISDLEKAQETLLRTGKSVEEVNYLMKDTVMLAKTGFMDTDDAAESLVTIANAYKYEADEMENVISKFLALDTASNTVAGNLSSAIAKAASNAQMAGVSIDELGGYISELKNTTGKSENEIATALNSMFSRVGNVKLGKYEIELEDGTSEDITQSLNDTERMLKNVGIQLRSSKGEFKDVDDILQEVSEHWKDFNSVEKNSIAKTFAGTQHRNTFISLIENYDKAMQLAEVSANSAGTATEKYEAYMESLEAKSAALSTSIKELWNDLVPNNLAGDMTDATTSIVQFIDKYEILQTAIKSAAFYALAKGVIATKNSFTGMVTDIRNVSTAMNLATQSGAMTMERMNGLAVAVKGLTDKQLMLVLSSSNLSEAQMIELLRLNGVTEAEARQKLATLGIVQANTTATSSTFSLSGAFKALWATIAANPIGALTIAFTGLVTIYQTVKRKQEEHIEEIKETADKAKELTNNINELYNAYDNMKIGVENGTESKENLTTATNNLLEALGYEGTAVDDLVNKYGNLTDAINQTTADSIKNSLPDLANAVDVELGELLETGNKVIAFSLDDTKANKELNDFVQKFSDKTAGLNMYHGASDSTFRVIVDTDKNSAEGLKQELDILNSLRNELFDHYGAENIQDIDFYNQLTDRITKLTEAYDNYSQSLKNYNDTAAQAQILQSLVGKEIPQTVEEYKVYRQELINSAKNSNQFIGSQEDIINAIDGTLGKMSEFEAIQNRLNNLDLAKSMFGVGSNINNGFEAGKKKFLEELSDEYLAIAIQIPDLFADGLDGASKKIQEFKADPNNSIAPSFDYSTYSEQVDTVVKNLDKVQSAIDKLNEGKGIDGKDITELANTFPEYSSKILSASDNTEKLKAVLKDIKSDAPSSLIDTLTNLKDLSEEDQEAVNGLITILSRLTNESATYADTLSDLDTKESLMSTAYKEMHDDGQISISTYQKLISLGDDYADLISIVDGKLIVNAKSIRDLTDAKYADEIATLKLAKAELEYSIAGNLGNADSYIERINAINEEIKAKEKARDLLSGFDYTTTAKKDKDEKPERVLAFEKELAKREHEINMGLREENDAYYDWLLSAAHTAYDGLKDYQDELWKHEETVYKWRKDKEQELFDEKIENMKTLADKALDSKNVYTELSKEQKELADFNKKMQSEFGLGNVDLTKRPKVSMDDGSTATVLSSSEFLWQGDEENGRYVAVHYTPILPDGTVLDDDTLAKYLYETLEGSDDILKADTKGIVLKVDAGLNITDEDIASLETGNYTENIQNIIKECDDWDVALHNIQEEWLKVSEAAENSTSITLTRFEYARNQITSAISEIQKRINDIQEGRLAGNVDDIKALNDELTDLRKTLADINKDELEYELDNEKAYWEDLKSKQEDIYDKEIDKLEKVKDAISKKNEEEEKATDLAEKQLALEKAKLELEKARQNRSVMLVTKQGTFYTADQSAIDEAEKNVKDAEKDIADAKKDDVTDKISEQIDVLKEQKENTQNYYDTIIKLLEDSQNDPLQAEANRDLWGKILATENGQNAIASADQDQVNKLIENGFLAFNDGKYSLNNPNAEVPRDSQAIDTTDIKNVLTTLFGKKEGYTPERIDSIAEKFELYKHRLYGGTAPSDVVNKATENVSKTINNSQVINKVQNMNTTYHIDKIEVGYSGNDFEGLLADTLDSISQQIIIDGNKALHGR